MFHFSWGKAYGILAHSSMEQLEEELVISKTSEKKPLSIPPKPTTFLAILYPGF